MIASNLPIVYLIHKLIFVISVNSNTLYTVRIYADFASDP
jgi:hypothetical protein